MKINNLAYFGTNDVLFLLKFGDIGTTGNVFVPKKCRKTFGNSKKCSKTLSYTRVNPFRPVRPFDKHIFVVITYTFPLHILYPKIQNYPSNFDKYFCIIQDYDIHKRCNQNKILENGVDL